MILPDPLPAAVPLDDLPETPGANATLQEARNWLLKALISLAPKRKGVQCPCCDRHDQIYGRNLNAGLALFLLRISQRFGDEWFHVNKDVTNHRDFNADYGKLEHWGFIERMSENSGPNKKSSGYWRVTPKGHQFVRGEIKVPTPILVLNNEAIGVAMNAVQIDIDTALAASGRSYAELLGKTKTVAA